MSQPLDYAPRPLLNRRRRRTVWVASVLLAAALATAVVPRVREHLVAREAARRIERITKTRNDAQALTRARRYQEALDACDRLLADDPSDAWGRGARPLIYDATMQQEARPRASRPR